MENKEKAEGLEKELEIDGEEEHVYPMNGVKIDKGFYTVFELKRRYDAAPKRIILDSDFQREEIWARERKSELIESVLMGLPLPIFYFNQDKYGNLIVVDGRQRLTALFEFMEGAFPLRRLKILTDLNDRHFSGLSPVLKGRLEDFQIQAHVILPPTPDRIKFDIFDRVNRGGMQLNKQEIRNALYQGEATKLLKRLIGSEAFQSATGRAFARETRMKDRYLLTRFMSFYLYRCDLLKDDAGNEYIYQDDMDEILGKGMEYINSSMSPARIQELEKMVLETLDKSAFYLGPDAFRLSSAGRRSPINMNAFEVVMFAMLQIPAQVEGRVDAVRKHMRFFFDSAAFRENIRSHRDGASKIEWRLGEAVKIGRLLAGDDM